MDLKAGQTDQMHSHLSEMVFFVKGSKVNIHLPDGKCVEADVPDGHVMWNEGWTHRAENIGSSDLQAIIVESKQSA